MSSSVSMSKTSSEELRCKWRPRLRRPTLLRRMSSGVIDSVRRFSKRNSGKRRGSEQDNHPIFNDLDDEHQEETSIPTDLEENSNNIIDQLVAECQEFNNEDDVATTSTTTTSTTTTSTTTTSTRTSRMKLSMLVSQPSQDAELSAKLKKWKESADNESPVFTTSSWSSTSDCLPLKSARFRVLQLSKLIEGRLEPPQSRRHTREDVRRQLDIAIMQLRAEQRARKLRADDQQYNHYDTPRRVEVITRPQNYPFIKTKIHFYRRKIREASDIDYHKIEELHG